MSNDNLRKRVRFYQTLILLVNVPVIYSLISCAYESDKALNVRVEIDELIFVMLLNCFLWAGVYILLKYFIRNSYDKRRKMSRKIILFDQVLTNIILECSFLWSCIILLLRLNLFQFTLSLLFPVVAYLIIRNQELDKPFRDALEEDGEPPHV